MGTTFSSCLSSDDTPKKNKNNPPLPHIDAFRSSEDSRDSSMTRGVLEASITRLAGAGGKAMVRLVHRSGTSCEIYLLGACITSFRQANGVEVLHTPPTLADDMKNGKPIEGGIPIIFPQFDKGGGAGLENNPDVAAMPPDGFARLLPWKVDDRQSAVQPDGSVHLVLTLVDSTQTRLRGFPYAFELEYGIKLTSRSLQVSLTVGNPRLVVWAEGFQCMLRTHLAIGAPKNVSLHGMSSASYLDRLDSGNKKVENAVSSRDPDTGDFARGLGGLRFDSAVDRVYLAGTGHLGTFTSAEVHVGSPQDASSSQSSHAGRGVESGVTTVDATCSRAAMATWGDTTPSPDMLISGGTGRKDMLCIAPGLISSPITSLVSGRMTLTQTITHRPDDPS